MHRRRRVERFGIALVASATVGWGCHPPVNARRFDPQAQKFWRQYNPDNPRGGVSANEERSQASLADDTAPSTGTAKEERKPSGATTPCEGTDELRDEIDALRSKIAGLRTGSADVERSQARRHEERELARAVDRLADVEHRLEKLERETRPEASAQAESEPRLDELSSQLDELERRTDELEGKRSPAAPQTFGRRARRAATAPATLHLEGHVEAANGNQLVVRSDDGELLVLSISGDTMIHEEERRLTPDEIPGDAKVEVRADRHGGRLEATEVRVEKKEG